MKSASRIETIIYALIVLLSVTALLLESLSPAIYFNISAVYQGF